MSTKSEYLHLIQERQRRAAKNSLYQYVKYIWPVIEPGREFIDNWHIRVICEHLEACFRREITQLIINIPPRHMKSSIIGVAFPSWIWLHQPHLRSLFSSYAENLSTRDSIKTRRVIDSRLYQLLKPNFKLASDQNQKTKFENDQTGYRLSTSVGGATTGEGGDFIVVDDPHKAQEIHSKVRRESVITWWDESMSTRGNDKNSVKIIVMQRLHKSDLAGHLLSQGGWEHLNIPAEYVKSRTKTTSLGFKDPRTIDGQVLWPKRFDQSWLERQKLSLGIRATMAQMQQDPTSEEGAIISRSKIRYYDSLPPHIHQWIQSWDLAFKGNSNSDFVVGQVWCRYGANKYLVDQTRGRFDINKTLEEIERMSAKYPKARLKIIENKANGPAVKDLLKDKLSGIILVEPDSDKISRLSAVSPQFDSENVFFPKPENCKKYQNEDGVLIPWIETLIEELIGFPNVENDDQVDTLSQALDHLENSSNKRLQDLVTL